MSDLQTWLLIIGAAVVVAVLLFNWSQERRFRKQTDAAFQTPMGDGLIRVDAVPRERQNRVEPALHEPVFDVGAIQQGVEPHEPYCHIDSESPPVDLTDDSAEPIPAHDSGNEASPNPAVLHPAPAFSASLAPARATAPTGSMAALKAAPYDELMEYRVRIGNDGVLANVFADAFNQARTLGKTVRWLGLPVGGSDWEDVQPWRDAHYQQVVVTLQLADRNGAAQEEQLMALCALLQTTAQAHGLRMACDDRVDALERAQAIDRFCVDVDVLIGLNVVARGEEIGRAHV